MKQRFAVYMLLPVGVLLLVMGLAGFTYARNRLLAEWGEATILKLQRAAHYVDMQLNKPKEMLKLFNESAGMHHAASIQTLILERLKQFDWVAEVNLEWTKGNPFSGENQMMQRHMKAMGGGEDRSGMFSMMPFHHGSSIRITAPRFDAVAGGETVSLISELTDADNETVGRVEVKIFFKYLVDTVEATGWWQDHEAFIVDDTGRILASNMDASRTKLAKKDSTVAKSILYATQNLPFGTVFGKGSPPEEVGGFYKLAEAPWVLVMVAPGREILSTIINFRYYYFIFGSVFVFIILVIIRFVTGRTVASIRDVSQAAHTVAEGNYDVTLPVRSQDEVGELIRSFNKMVTQLEERARLKYSLNLASEVQQNLLPGNGVGIEALEVAGRSIYCDETGGDYYDYLQDFESEQDRVGITVGDVSDHGIAASLFMTTARALVRSRFTQGGSAAQIVTDVNRLLCKDTARTGNFMTLFFALFDIRKKEIQWVRAGHDPAILYDAVKDDMQELGGKGMALGVDDTYPFKEYIHRGWDYGHVLVIGTDGIWDTENQKGERFGKERLRRILRNNSHVSAEKILTTVTDKLTTFRQGKSQGDDVTLVVIKAKTNS